jgi:hypothetical protein
VRNCHDRHCGTAERPSRIDGEQVFANVAGPDAANGVALIETAADGGQSGAKAVLHIG